MVDFNCKRNLFKTFGFSRGQIIIEILISRMYPSNLPVSAFTRVRGIVKLSILDLMFTFKNMSIENIRYDISVGKLIT